MIDRGELLRKLVLHAARLSLLAPIAGRLLGGIGAILMVHRINDDRPRGIGVNRHLTVTPGFLDAVLTEVRRMGYVFVSMDEAVDRLKSRSSGQRFVTITADDGYRDNLTDALPVLERHEAPITVHVAPALTEGKVLLWWDLLEEIIATRDVVYLSLPEGPAVFDCDTPTAKFRANTEIHNYLTDRVAEEDQVRVIEGLARSCGIDPLQAGHASLMDWNELRRFAAHPLVTIGAHTVHHYNLRRLSAEKALRELADARRLLRVELGETPSHMAYPYGYEAAVGKREVDLAREAGYASAVTTRHGLLQTEHASHLQALPRISVNGRYQQVAHVGTMLSGITTPIANRGQRVVTV
ncbi:polysaccharide deacetylase [Aquibium carbonis]|uniref:Chitooligosaccharide deacetylase n=1 Tax=Aquibium carbonis TaxID=2495581 RepID=A0A3S0GAB8_9HYPH|nr:polysaccharide deacetylase family protein [Aquibium carbonis]RST87327.1 polysaccharide deacetylase [Aquibium carbonis]